MADLTLTIDVSQASEALAGLQRQADALLSTLQQCKGACEGCKLNVAGEFKLRGSDLVAISRVQGYRDLRSE